MARIAFDIDGVLARGLDVNKLNSGRDDKIYGNLILDRHCLPLIEKLRKNNTIYILTARPSHHKGVTISWLNKHNLIYDKLFLNHYNDWRAGPQYKAEIIQRERIDVLIDDTPEIIDYVNRNTKCRAILFSDWEEVESELI
ncbi:MAG: hypothetical protein DRO89_00170 [Candidatus Altiarchaeales archaeon]|nr:MAG: hypothetical protein DRO89_00170 [Candidatus Altiarchaeales archaeon]